MKKSLVKSVNRSVNSVFLMATAFVGLTYDSIFSVSYAGEYSNPWGVPLSGDQGKDGKSTSPFSKIKVGGRIQAMATSNTSGTSSSDAYLRRLRFNVEYDNQKDRSIYFDIRNDNVDESDSSSGEFTIGDAFLKQKIGKDTNLKFFRAKVDISYSQQSSSRNLLHPDRMPSSDHASDFIFHARRSTNAQVNKKLNLNSLGVLTIQLATGDGVSSDSLSNQSWQVSTQRASYGAKLRWFLGREKPLPTQDSFYKPVNHFSLGFGHHRNDRIVLQNSSASTEFTSGRSLISTDLSIGLGPIRLLSEWFYFENDLALANTSVNLMTSKGGYASLEYFIKERFAIYAQRDQFQQNQLSGQETTITQRFGANFYTAKDNERYGVAWTQTHATEGAPVSLEQSLSLTALFNF